MNVSRDRSVKTAESMTACVTIVHQNAWDPERHGPLFLQPLIEGFLLRLRTSPLKDSQPISPS